MRLTPQDQEKLLFHLAGMLARERKERGLKLNYTEAAAYISSELLELARDGKEAAELMNLGTKLLSTEDVMDGVPQMLEQVQIEATFPDGTKLVTVHHPIRPRQEEASSSFTPGEVMVGADPIVLNKGKAIKTIRVANLGDRPIQVGSHYHFFEVNKSLSFDRKEAFGFRLDIPSGTSVRFEPGEEKTVNLTELGGKQEVFGLNDLTRGRDREAAEKEAAEKGFFGEGYDER